MENQILILVGWLLVGGSLAFKFWRITSQWRKTLGNTRSRLERSWEKS